MSTLGLTSSAHAVRGFGELLFITCLNLAIIAVAMRFTKQNDGSTPAYLKILFTLLIAFNFVIMASSHMRLMYYESSYGHTVARFISHSFMILLMIVNAIALARIYSSRVKVIKFFAAAALIYMCALVAINPEATVVRSNIQRYEETGKVDTAYMFTLSGGAVSEACDFITEHPELYDKETQGAAERKYRSYSNTISGGWQSLNIADRTAYLKLQQLP